jgi:hypothetical protein
MRRFVQLSLLGLAAGVSACSTPDLVHPTEVLPYAGVRFVNAVPDTAGAFGLDFRFVDLLESNAHFRITFRNTPSSSNAPATEYPTAVQYKGAREGSRHFKIFFDDTLQSVASVALKDTSVSLVKGHNYTAMLWGNSRSAATTFAGSGGDKMALSFWEEDVTAPAAGKVKMRVINTTSAPIDVYAFPTTPGTVPATPTWAAVPAYSRSTYVEVDTTGYTYRVRQTSAPATVLFADRNANVGAPASCSGVFPCPTGAFPDIDAIPGTRISGSAVSGIVFPASVAGSRAAQFSTQGIYFVWDRRPARTCDPYC